MESARSGPGAALREPLGDKLESVRESVRAGWGGAAPLLLPDLPLDTFSTISLGPLASGTREGRRAGAGRRRENPAGAKRGRREGLRRGDLPPFPPLSTGPERNKQRAKASGKRGDVPAGSRGSGGSSPSRPSRPPAAQAVAAGGGGRGGGHRHRGISAALRASAGVCRLRCKAPLGA